VALLATVLVHRSQPVYLTPYSVAQGNGKSSYHVIYFAPVGYQDSDSTEHVPITAKSTALKQARAKRERSRPAPVNLHNGDSADQYARAGSRYGTLAVGPIDGREVRPALPVVFPDPPVSRAELPPGLQGDVIVEVTIDINGKVIETRLLQTIGNGIDEKVVATLQSWHFTPATLDGVPVVSKHDVHFHFPS
jgi:TonB family protein